MLCTEHTVSDALLLVLELLHDQRVDVVTEVHTLDAQLQRLGGFLHSLLL